MSHNWPYRGLLAATIVISASLLADAQTPVGPIGVAGGIPASGTAGGDLTGTYPNPTISTSANINPSSIVCGSATGGGQGASTINCSHIYKDGGEINPLTAGVGIDFNSNIATPHAVEHISWVSTIANALTTNFGGLHKFSAASTVDNGVLSVEAFTCTGNPTLLALNCHADNTCGTSPTTIATVTPSAAGITDLTVSSSAIAANEYVGFHQTGGTCTVLNLQMTLQIHAN